MNPAHSWTSPYHIVGRSRWALCCVPRLTESHFTCFSLKEFRKRSDLMHAWPEIDTQVLSHRGQSACSLSSSELGQGITHFCEHSGQNQRIGQHQLKFFPSSPCPDGIEHAALLDGLFQSTNICSREVLST